MQPNRFLFYYMLFVILFIFLFPLRTVAPAPELKVYQKEYNDLVKEECPGLEFPRNLGLGFTTLSKDEIGVCNIFLAKRQILVDKTFWNLSSELDRKQLMFHELTHCTFNIGHVENPNNYMNPYLMHISEEDLIIQVKQVSREQCKH